MLSGCRLVVATQCRARYSRGPCRPFEANIDIRDTVKYKEVMKQYGAAKKTKNTSTFAPSTLLRTIAGRVAEPGGRLRHVWMSHVRYSCPVVSGAQDRDLWRRSCAVRGSLTTHT